ncbi:MAG: acyltransferase [Lachnospiraceae bacterium]|nr:acyltransferase [Lachnospiraceae bacterium]
MKERNVNLDIVRIIAALMVLFVHVGYEFPWIGDYTWTGYYGVMLFFVLSGYLSMVSVDNSADALTFYKKRLLRIVPLYWAVLVIAYILELITYLPQQGLAVFSSDGPCGIAYLRYFVFLNMTVPSENFTLWNNRFGFWTLPAFVLFYLLAPLIRKLIRQYFSALCVLIILLFCYHPFVAWLQELLGSRFPWMDSPEVFAQWTPVSVLYCFFFGVTVYYAKINRREFSFVILCIISMIFNEFRWFAWEIVMALLVLGAISLPSLIPGAADSAPGSAPETTPPDKPAKPALRTRLTQWIATASAVSFPLYLTHILTLSRVMKLQNILTPVIRHKGFLLFVLAVCMVVAYLTWRFIAKPLDRLLLRGRSPRTPKGSE